MCLLRSNADLDYCNSIFPGLYKEEEEETLKGLLLSLGHVEELKIGKTCLKAFFRLEAKGFVFPSCMTLPDVTSLDFFDSDSSTDSDSGLLLSWAIIAEHDPLSSSPI